jgi:hypothetical protein
MSNRPRRRKNDDSQDIPKKGRLNNMELFGIGLMLLFFLMYGISKCSQGSETNTAVVTEQSADSLSVENNSVSAENNSPLPPRKIDTSSFKNKLYITTDSLRIRKEPKIGAPLIGYLSLGEEVIDMGERTVHEKIRITASEFRRAPWVKIKTKDGLKGWAF